MNTKADRFAQLARLGGDIFHIDDLASLWQIKDPNTLHTTLKRYTQRGLLYRIYRSLYAIRPVSELNSHQLGTKALHKYAYISTETVLSQHGIILQGIPYITLVSSQSKRFTIGKNNYYCRQLTDKFLFNQAGVENINGVYTATLSRAVADLLYFNPRAHLDAPRQIDWAKVKKIQQELDYPIVNQKS